MSFDSEFNRLMAGADQMLMDRFGTECAWLKTSDPPDTEPIRILVDLETGLTAQELGERGRAANGSRVNQMTLGTFLVKDLPADLTQVVLIVNGQRYRLTEPVDNGGEIECLLLPDIPTDQSGSKTSSFLNMP
ncbi:hypothetical protein [Oceanospirillum sediminis]|uniref:Uncharacterized protein n=1 Tax=Oceanospirillum sediminis TaxID=2760088 RepID=A0A839IWQ2_9GAMM|nr:hypothetical protein [Oceanospirillum sediminis]MBB1489388.1 hypothetical protein [Oceanospirillum sediminis]